MLLHTLSISQSLETATWLHSAPQEMEDCPARVDGSVHYSLITKQIYLLFLVSGGMFLSLTDFVYLTPFYKTPAFSRLVFLLPCPCFWPCVSPGEKNCVPNSGSSILF